VSPSEQAEPSPPPAGAGTTADPPPRRLFRWPVILLACAFTAVGGSSYWVWKALRPVEQRGADSEDDDDDDEEDDEDG